DRVVVRTAEAVGTIAGEVGRIKRQLERTKLCLLGIFLRDNLVDGHAELNVGTVRLLGATSGQPRRLRARMLPVVRGERLLAIQSRDHRQVLAKRLERL